MNPMIRGMRSAFRVPLRSGAIVLMIAISIGLILSMLAARSSINAKISSVESSTANQITVSPAGMQGGFGNAQSPLTSANLTTIQKTAHAASTNATLTDRLTNQDAASSNSSSDTHEPGESSSSSATTSLTPSQTLGAFGARQMGQSGSGMSNFTPTPRITVTGTNNPSEEVTSSQIMSGSPFSGTISSNVAMVGTNLASKNNLKVGSTFTAYGQTITVGAIYKTNNNFSDNGLIMPLTTVQNLSGQSGDISSITVYADSSNNVSALVSNLKKSLGSSADITSDAAEADNLVTPLKSIATLAIVGVLAAAGAGAVIILLAMTIVVRERRREVGVMKAIGAKTSKIITQFSTEAFTLTLIGGVIGLAIGIAMASPVTSLLASNASSTSSSQTPGGMPGMGSQGGAGRSGGMGGFNRVGGQLRQNLTTITSTISLSTIALSVSALFVIALLGSIIPSLLISKVKPAEILRSE